MEIRGEEEDGKKEPVWVKRNVYWNWGEREILFLLWSRFMWFIGNVGGRLLELNR